MESKLLIQDKEIAVPGEILAEGMDFVPGPGTYRIGETIVASRLGLVQVDGRALKLIPMSGKYMPKRDDTIIGQVVDILFSGWRVDINSAYPGMLNIKDATSDFVSKGADLTQYYTFGDYIVTKITNVTSQKLVDLSMRGPGLKKLKGGRIISVNPSKVPRIIGKQGSMVSLIKEATYSRITVGQNGLIWIDGEPENELVAIEAIRKIENEAHLAGLTEKVKEFLDANKSRIKEVEMKPEEPEEQPERFERFDRERPRYGDRPRYNDRPPRREGDRPFNRRRFS
ncbi:RNA-binding protein [Candidatus Woesearchaeota archaeon]|nr:RNA-binding protein [Candidatus Woesearchaeota archaeon]